MEMKYYSLFLLFILLTLPAKAKNLPKRSIAVAYSDVSSGRNINFTFRYAFHEKWTGYLGLKYNINSKYFRNDYTLKTKFYKESFADNSFQHFGLRGGVEKLLWRPNPYLQIFVGYDAQFTYATIKSVNQDWQPWLYPFPGRIPVPDYLNDFLLLENILGIGAKISINKQMNFGLSAGLGMTRYYRIGTGSTSNNYSGFWTFARLLDIGVIYSLDKQEKPTGRRKRSEDRYIGGANSLHIGYDDLQTGRNLNIGYQHHMPGGLGLYAAVKYHINTRFYRDYTITEPYYFKQFRPEGFAEHLGLTLGIEKSVHIPYVNLEPFAFYELHGMRATVSNLVDLDHFASGISRPLLGGGAGLLDQNLDYYQAWFRKYGPVLALENYAGLGARMMMSEKINFRIKAGIGYNIYLGPDNFQTYTTNGGNLMPEIQHENVPWTAKKSEISRMFSFALEYRLNKGKGKQ